VKILSRGIRKDKGERGTIETEMKTENVKETCMVIPMQDVIHYLCGFVVKRA